MKKINKSIILVLLLGLLLSLSGCVSFGLQINQRKIKMEVGDEIVLNVNTSKEVKWKSDDEKIVVVNDKGVVTAIKEGAANITAEIGKEKLTALVRVSDYSVTKQKTVIYGTQKIEVGSTTQLTLKTNDVAKKPQMWKSSDNSIAVVDVNGVVTGKSVGISKISAISNGVRTSIDILVTTGSGSQDVLKSYIYNYVYNLKTKVDLTSLSDKLVASINDVKESVIGVGNYIRKNGNLNLQGTGSGVIIEKTKVGSSYKYKAITNNHVTKNSDKVTAYLGYDDKEVEAAILKTDPAMDLTLIEFTYSKDIKVSKFVDSESWQVGDFVYALGCPDGFNFFGSATFGIISNPKRKMAGETALFIQHDAAINPGNSGGPLFDINGNIIGINTLKLATVEIEGMGFAVTANNVKDFLK